MFNSRMYGNSRPDGFPVLEIAPTTGEGGDTTTPRQFVPLQNSRLSGRVAGPLANLTLTQTFAFSRPQSEKTIEALYRFPLPGDAAVTGVVVRFGDTEIRAALKEREEAEAEYEEAKAAGRQAALTSRESPDVFTLRVAGIGPDQEVVIQTEYVQLAREEAGGMWSLRVPLTTVPRYTRSDEFGSRSADGQPLAVLRDPGHRFSLEVTIDAATDIRSGTHTLTVADEGAAVSRVTLAAGDVVPDRDLMITWKAKAEGDRPALRLFTHAEPNAPDSPLYFLAQVAPPSAPKSLEHRGNEVSSVAPREVILLVDHSGSMEGAKWEAADWAVIRFLSDLTERDSFALGLFHNSCRWFKDRPVNADRKTVEAATEFLKRHRDSGGTELGVALEQGLHLPQTGSGDVSRHVLIITDAAVSDSGRILRLAEEGMKQEPGKRRRVSVLCIDAAPNSFLATELAERGGGIARFLTSAPDEEDITTALDTILEEWSAPLLVGMRLAVDRANVAAAERTVWHTSDASEVDLGDLPTGRSRWVAGRIPGGASEGTHFTLVAGFGRQSRTVAEWEEEAARYEGRPEIKALFGARKVLALEYLQTMDYAGDDLKDQLRRLGYDPKAVLEKDGSGMVYAENRREETGKSLRKLLASAALEYGLASSQTSFIAVRMEAGKPVEETHVVANALASGWSEGVLGAPAGMPMMAAAPMATGAMPPPSPMLYASPVTSARSASGGGGGIGGFIQRIFGGGDATRGSGPVSPEPLAHPELAKARAVSPLADRDDYETNAPAQPVHSPLFSGIPTFAGDRATLFDSRQGAGIAENTTLTRLGITFPDGAPDAASLPPGLEVLLFVDDLAAPRARVRLSDLIKQNGVRPLNVRRVGNAPVLVVLSDPDGIWSDGKAPKMVLMLS